MSQLKSSKDGAGTQLVDPRFQYLLTLISLQKSARHRKRKSELEFLMVNQTFNLVPYRHCVFWQKEGDSVAIIAASGLVQLDQNGPYALWLKEMIVKFLAEKITTQAPKVTEEEFENYVIVTPLTIEDAGVIEAEEWEKWVSNNALLFALKDRDDNISSGVWIDRHEPFNDAERAFLEDLMDGYAHAMQAFDADKAHDRKKAFWKSWFSLSKSNVKRVALVVFLILLIPVRMSVTAPAEIVAHTPYLVSVPFDGVIETVEVSPGQSVQKGDLLVRMNSTVLKNRSDLTSMESETAEIAFNKTEREALVDRTKLADISILRSQVDTKISEKKFAAELLAQSEIRAARDGVAIFSDANGLRGKPVRTGEQIMLLADPQDSELLIRIPVEAMIQINEDVPATFFLNVSPLGFRDAKYDSISYQASLDPDGLLTYKVRARFDKDGTVPRVGWTGTGKVYGHRTIMAYNVFRRPLVTLRRKLGV